MGNGGDELLGSHMRSYVSIHRQAAGLRMQQAPWGGAGRVLHLKTNLAGSVGFPAQTFEHRVISQPEETEETELSLVGELLLGSAVTAGCLQLCEPPTKDPKMESLSPVLGRATKWVTASISLLEMSLVKGPQACGILLS